MAKLPRRLKEARIDRGMRLLFAFDSNQNAVVLIGGDKTGKGNRWYPRKIEMAEIYRRLMKAQVRIAHTLYCATLVTTMSSPPSMPPWDDELSEAQRREDLFLSALSTTSLVPHFLKVISPPTLRRPGRA